MGDRRSRCASMQSSNLERMSTTDPEESLPLRPALGSTTKREMGGANKVSGTSRHRRRGKPPPTEGKGRRQRRGKAVSTEGRKSRHHRREKKSAPKGKEASTERSQHRRREKVARQRREKVVETEGRKSQSTPNQGWKMENVNHEGRREKSTPQIFFFFFWKRSHNTEVGKGGEGQHRRVEQNTGVPA